MQKKITIAFGTRPELIRFSPIIHELTKLDDVKLSLVHTGQHYTDNMNDIFFRELNIPEPDVNLAVGGMEPNEQMAGIISGMGKVINKEKPDIVCVWGDTNSSLGVAIAANKKGVNLCHLESGCRSHDFRMAEEYNRILIDHLSDLLFPLSLHDSKNLQTEKVHGDAVFLGDPLLDVFLENQKKIAGPKADDNQILLTLHRAENVDNKTTLKNILTAISKIKNKSILFPVHPRTLKMIEAYGIKDLLKGIKVVPPLSYFEILKTLKECDLVITDSGGLQKEAFFAQKTCITLRKSTEWLDTVRLKVNIVLDPESKQLDNLAKLCQESVVTNNIFKTMKEKPYGNGDASKQIVQAIIKFLQK